MAELAAKSEIAGGKSAKPKPKHAVRVLRFGIVGCDQDFAAAKAHFKDLAVSVQRLTNDFWTTWLAAHIRVDSPAKVRKWMSNDIAWAKLSKAERGKRVPCPVKPLDAAMSRKIYAALREAHPEIHTRPLVLAMNIEWQRLIGTKASKSAYPRWMKILAGDGEFPSYSRPLPIPLDKGNSRIVPPKKDSDAWLLRVSLDATLNGKRGAAFALKLKRGGRNFAGHREALWKIAAGDWKWAGSSLLCKDGLWYAHLCYQLPAAVKFGLDKDRVAYLNPAADRPVHLWIDGFAHWLRRDGRDVRHVRGQLVARRWSTAEGYRHASSARKGHGAKRAMAWREKLRRRWLDFRKTYNECLAWDATEALIRQKVGRLVYYQPVGDRRETRFLAKAGAAGRSDLREWDWFQLGSLLARKCEEKGIEFEVRRCGREGFRRAKNGANGNGSQKLGAGQVEAVSN